MLQRYAWLLALAWLASCASAAPSTPPGPIPCAEAVQRIQAYKAPGQSLSLKDVYVANLTREALRRPVAPEGWSLSRASDGPRETLCIVNAQANIGNEHVIHSWQLWLDTGRVEARDDATKRISGW